MALTFDILWSYLKVFYCVNRKPEPNSDSIGVFRNTFLRFLLQLL